MKSIEKVIACFKELGFKPSVADFEDRLKIQKIVYLLNLKGIRVGFDYNLHVRGPYSPALAREIFSNQDDVQNLRTSSELTKQESKSVDEFKRVFEIKSGILEVAATYAYFAFEQEQDPLTALKNVRALKPFFSEAQIAIGVSKAKEFLFKPTEKELEEMKKEHRLWQGASLSSIN
jgi:uncharacterized protein YwgA